MHEMRRGVLALILYKNNIQRKEKEKNDRIWKALILYKNNIQHETAIQSSVMNALSVNPL